MQYLVYSKIEVVNKNNDNDPNSIMNEMIFGAASRCNVFNFIRFEHDKQNRSMA